MRLRDTPITELNQPKGATIPMHTHHSKHHVSRDQKLMHFHPAITISPRFKMLCHNHASPSRVQDGAFSRQCLESLNNRLSNVNHTPQPRRAVSVGSHHIPSQNPQQIVLLRHIGPKPYSSRHRTASEAPPLHPQRLAPGSPPTSAGVVNNNDPAVGTLGCCGAGRIGCCCD
ncbi:hypothetical protein BCR34DRAFT_386352 [Clohesyomyces aquaticus]|uniref:Uncharacterized protein n=1 Tax=Clohesyomyces aquaticus TaxID=1231657 RepID=A0A1Y1ZGK8_9PLEO|nr:hypothetical protein BCR34DRAFT_386352 [Clohesyomyces aquaticus]